MNTTALLKHGLLNGKWEEVGEIVLIFSKWIYDETTEWMWKKRHS